MSALPDAHHHGPSPQRRLLRWLTTERQDVSAIVAYSVVIILLTLAVPLTVQTLVNTIAAGVYLGPVVVSASLLLLSLATAGGLKLAQFVLVEVLQQRLFVRVALHMGQHLPQLDELATTNLYGPELANRFFDVINLQKAMAKLLVLWPSALLQVLVGMVLLGIYSPFFILFNLALLVMIVAVYMAGHRGLSTSIDESHEKYRVAFWLQEVARCQSSLKLANLPPIIMRKTDALTADYIHARQVHFKVLFRQTLLSYGFQAMVHAGMLGLGGWLVITRQITIGQLVAAELVLVTMLAALENLMANATSVYDLLTAFSKVGHVIDTPTERHTGQHLEALPSAERSISLQGAKVNFKQVWFSYPDAPAHQPTLSNLSFELQAGQRVVLLGNSGAGKSTLLKLMAGLLPATQGAVWLDGLDWRTLSLDQARQGIGWLNQDLPLFEGTLEDNITLGRPIDPHTLQWALELCQLQPWLERLPQGLLTPLLPLGQNLPYGVRQLILLARTVVKRPRLLLLDEALLGLDEATLNGLLNQLMAASQPWTLVYITEELNVIARFDHLLVLNQGRLVEAGDLHSLAQQATSHVRQLYPGLAAMLPPSHNGGKPHGQ
jgi:ABC-type bacteriocin/lantibiotic exporter with double-glycine peptidase domain